MSGIGGGKPGSVKAFWDPNTESTFHIHDGTTFVDVIGELRSHIEKLEDRIKQLETAYMEKVILGEDNGDIRSSHACKD